MATIEQLKNALRDELGNFQEGFYQVPGTDRILGFVVSDEFESMTHQQRQQRLRELLDHAFEGSELLNLGPIATMTPEEASLHEVEE